MDLAQAIQNPTSAATSGITAPLGTTLGIGRIASTGVNFAAMLRALRSDGSTNIIAKPSAITMDNQEAQLKVAKEVPFVTGSYSSTGAGGTTGAVNPFQTIQREEVGTILKVTPQLNGSNTVILKIELESSNLAASNQGAVDLITNKRTISTNVMIEDGGIVVLGGLIEDSALKGETRVPFLGRIPIIGLAFKTRNAQATKNNLMVFIRPKILRDGVQTSFETDAKYNYIRDEQKRMDKTELLPLLPGTKKPTLEQPPPPPPPGTGEVDPRVEQEKRRGGQGDATAVQGQAGQEAPGGTQGPQPRAGAAGHACSAARNAPQPTRGASLMDDAVVAANVPERRLSFAFAKRHGVLVKRFVDGVAECAYRADTTPMALAEVRRYLRTKVKLERVDEPSFDALLRTAYEGGNSATMEANAGPRGKHRPRPSGTTIAHLGGAHDRFLDFRLQAGRSSSRARRRWLRR
ncbi:MAG: hypothetical protein WDO56_27750 [Gammaproteobacteria bacterium]